jgi:hypothetical protein
MKDSCLPSELKKIFCLYGVIFSLGLSGIFLSFSNASSQQWQETGTEHFIIYFTQEEEFAKEAARKAEDYYKDIALELGYPRYSEFWTWEKRVKIYIYPDHQSYLKATAQPEWSYGMADYRRKQISSFVWSSGFLESLLPHELAHLIFRDFVGLKGEIPPWLDEGVAQWSERAKRNEMRAMLNDLYQKDALLSLEDMMKLNMQDFKEKGRVYIRSTRTKEGKPGVLFLSAENMVNTYYLQAVSLVGFLIGRYGSDSFAEFCRQLRDGKNMEEALKFADVVVVDVQ